MSVSSNYRVIIPLELGRPLYDTVVAQAEESGVPVGVFCYGPCVSHINAFGRMNAVQAQPAKLSGAHFYPKGRGVAADLILSPALWTAVTRTNPAFDSHGSDDDVTAYVEQFCRELCAAALAEKTGSDLVGRGDGVAQEVARP